MLFRYQITTAILFGPGSISNLGQEAEKLGRKALLVTYPDIRRVGLLDKVLRALKEKNIDVVVFENRIS
jgi:alcohol dehydrogenase class IV